MDGGRPEIVELTAVARDLLRSVHRKSWVGQMHRIETMKGASAKAILVLGVAATPVWVAFLVYILARTSF